VVSDARHATAAFALSNAIGDVIDSGESEAVIGDETLTVGPVTVSYLDADVFRAADYRIELTLWPAGRVVLSQLGRRFDAFAQELGAARNQARVAGLLAHGITRPEIFSGAVIADGAQRPADFHVFDTHVTVVPADGDPWQLPLGAITAIEERRDPPSIHLATRHAPVVIGQLARQRDACQAAIVEQRGAQLRLLSELTGQAGFSDGWGIARSDVRDFDGLVEQFTAPNRTSSAAAVLSAATGEPRLGFVQLLDPDAEQLAGSTPLPPNWAAVLLVPVGTLTVFEMLAGPAAATYLFRGDIDAVNRDLQLMHFRRAPLALTAEQAEVTPTNPHRLALRRLEPLQRLRSITVGRLIHNSGWDDAFRARESAVATV
jgi:hypothetical protein